MYRRWRRRCDENELTAQAKTRWLEAELLKKVERETEGGREGDTSSDELQDWNKSENLLEREHLLWQARVGLEFPRGQLDPIEPDTLPSVVPIRFKDLINKIQGIGEVFSPLLVDSDADHYSLGEGDLGMVVGVAGVVGAGVAAADYGRTASGGVVGRPHRNQRKEFERNYCRVPRHSFEANDIAWVDARRGDRRGSCRAANKPWFGLPRRRSVQFWRWHSGFGFSRREFGVRWRRKDSFRRGGWRPGHRGPTYLLQLHHSWFDGDSAFRGP